VDVNQESDDYMWSNEVEDFSEVEKELEDDNEFETKMAEQREMHEALKLAHKRDGQGNFESHHS
jgi:hypothetical protein